eukprot:NODE_204_length_1815_cov_361.326136.p1 GENE.NODE_204_length_1815_cov_361.326136~~NODE_204_length_1815_cov_361.326136.p1  ORF type:complete len:449 (-),score=147.09 NODE_204_length_1815_cov_361.326136:453-1613(-)
MSFAVLIVGNAVTMSLRMQYAGFDLAHDLAYADGARTSAETWPGAADVLKALSYGFGSVFTLEVLLKVGFLRRRFFESLWNTFDACLAILWIVESLVVESIGVNPMLLRLCRLLRLVRLSRMVKTFQALDSLQVLVGSMSACISVLLWSGILLGFVMVVFGMFLNAMLTPYMEADGSGDLTLVQRQQLFTYFGSWLRCMITMFELTLGNFIPVTRILTENVDEGYGALLVIYKFIVSFAVVKVITGVFMHETFRVAASDDNLMVVQKVRTMKRHMKKMGHLLTRLDTSLDGKIDRAEFVALMEDSRLKMWLASMEVECENPNLLFDFIDNGDGQISLFELVRGVARLRGPARSIDLITIAARCQDLRERFIRSEEHEGTTSCTIRI